MSTEIQQEAGPGTLVPFFAVGERKFTFENLNPVVLETSMLPAPDEAPANTLQIRPYALSCLSKLLSLKTIYIDGEYLYSDSAYDYYMPDVDKNKGALISIDPITRDTAIYFSPLQIARLAVEETSTLDDRKPSDAVMWARILKSAFENTLRPETLEIIGGRRTKNFKKELEPLLDSLFDVNYLEKPVKT